jgi:hypothetical protein
MALRSNHDDSTNLSTFYISTPSQSAQTSNNFALKTAIIAEGAGWSRSNLHFCLKNAQNNNDSAYTATVADSKMVIDYDGNVGIGTTSPIYALDVDGVIRNNSSIIMTGGNLYNQSSYLNIESQHTSGYFRFRLNVGGTGGVDVMRISNNGNVGIGTTAPLSALNVQQTYALGTSNTTHFRPQLIVGGGSGGNISGIGINNGGLHNHLTCGSLYYKNISGYYGINGYLGLAVTNNAVHSGDGFGITEGELETLTHLAITSSTGYVGIGMTNPSEKLDVNGVVRATSFTSTSDDRVKHNETPLTDSLGLISQLHPKRYLKTQQMYDASLNLTIDASGNYTDISENDVVTEEIGIIAQDVLSIDDLSFLVKPSLDPSGNETGPMGLDYQSLFVLSIQAIQELKARIETLEAQVL